MALEKYYGEATAHKQTDVVSVTKSVVSALFGIAVGEGRIKGTNATLDELFPDFMADVQDARTRQISMHQMLSMTAGFRWAEQGKAYWNWSFSKNRAKVTLQQVQEREPGKVFNYNTGVAHVLGFAIEQAVSMPLLDYANTKLFQPLGWTQSLWERDPKGVYSGGDGLSLSPHQMAKIGYLFLNEGNWEGRQLIPRNWIQRATRNQLKNVSELGYGYLFWVRDFGGCKGYMAWGRGGQFIVVVPEKDLVVVITSVMRSQRSSSHYHPIFDIIADAASGACSSQGTIAQIIKNQPKSPATPLPKLPEGVLAYFESLNKAILSRNADAVMAHYSRKFFDSGEDYAARKAGWQRMLPKLTTWKFDLRSYDITDRGIAFEGWAVSNVRNLLFLGFLVQEDGRWLEQGSPEGAQSTAGISKDLVEFLRAFGRMLGRGRAEEMPPYFSNKYLSNGFSKAEFITFFAPFVPKLGDTSFRLTNYRRDGDVAEINGTINYGNIGDVPLRFSFGHIIRENGRWGWYGNQVSE
jgi:hypothetical protein